MTISMYQASIPVFLRGLNNLSALLQKAEDHAKAKNLDPSVFTTGALTEDMFPLTRQVQIATDSAKGCAARLAGIEVPSFEDNEKTFAELQARIKKTIAFIESVKPAQVDGSEERAVTIKTRSDEFTFPGQTYLTAWAMPNFYFHVVTAYDILRHKGVEIGKKDYLGKVA